MSPTPRSAPTPAARWGCTGPRASRSLTCHQSQFDVSDGAKPFFGPAARPLPHAPGRRRGGHTGGPGRLPGAGRARVLGHESRPMMSMVERSFKYLDERLGTASLARATLRKVFPDHWSFLLGEIALFSLVVLIFTGVFLTFFYTPSIQEVSTTARTSRCRAPRLGRLQLGAAAVVRGPGRAADAPDPPLGGPGVRGLDRRPPVPGVLHRRPPPARSTGWSASACCSWPWARASPATRSPTTC